MSPLIRCYPEDRVLDLLLVAALAAALVSSAAWLISRRRAGHAALRHLVLFSALICCLATPAAVWFCGAAGLTLISLPLLRGEQAETVSGAAWTEIDEGGKPARTWTCPPAVASESPTPHTTTTDPSANVAAACAGSEHERAHAVQARRAARQHVGDAPVLSRNRRRDDARLGGRRFVDVGASGAECARVVRLRRLSRPLRNESHQSLLREIAGRLRAHQVPLLLVSNRAVPPLAVGFGRPAIILPERLLGAVSDDELRDVFVHEVAHIRRRDQRVVLLQELAAALYWPIASIHALNRELQVTREELCDNVVLAGRDAISYGKTLLHVAELLVGARPMGAALGVIGGRGKLEERISGLLDPRRKIMTKIGRKTVCVVGCLFIVAGFIASATRFEASAAPPAEGPQPDAKPPAVKTATCPESSDKGQGDKAAVEARACETKARSWGFRHRHAFTSDNYEGSLIGGLVENGHWAKSLPLAPAQASAITKLDVLVRDAGDRAAGVAADYMDTNPPDYQEYNARLGGRLK